MTTTIYRVENINGTEPYRDIKVSSILAHHNECNEHPTPQVDKGIKRQPQQYEFFGFENISQLLQWFTKKELKELKKYGYFIRKIQGTITSYGQKQIMFIREEPPIPTIIIPRILICQAKKSKVTKMK